MLKPLLRGRIGPRNGAANDDVMQRKRYILMPRVTTDEKRIYKTVLPAPNIMTEKYIRRKILTCSCHTQLQGSKMTLNETPKIDANSITPTLGAGPDSFTMGDLPDAKSDAGETSDTDEEKPSRSGKAPQSKNCPFGATKT